MRIENVKFSPETLKKAAERRKKRTMLRARKLTVAGLLMAGMMVSFLTVAFGKEAPDTSVQAPETSQSETQN